MTKYFQISQGTARAITAYDDCPVWVLTEIVSYGQFMKLYQYYYTNSGKKAPIAKNLLEIIRKLRNGAAHDSCIIANLHASSSSPPAEIKEAVKAVPTISRSQRQKKLTARPILEFVTLLYVYQKIVGEDVKRHRMTEVKELFNSKMKKHGNYFAGNDILVTSYNFVSEIIKHFS